RGQSQADRYTALVYSDFPGEFDEKEAGGRYAGVRLEEYQCQRHVVHMSATVRTLGPGYRFTLTDHPTEAPNREDLITHAPHRARQPQSLQDEAAGDEGIRYEATIRAIPSEVAFRPPRRTPRPLIVGGQTAVVVGPEGEEIYTDDDGYGRVRVQFHWDRNG